MRLRKLFPILFFLILLAGSISTTKAEPRFTPLNVYEYYNDIIETSMIFDGANYLYVTPYGNYSITQPLNIISFTDYQGNEIIEKSIFVLHYNSTGSWLPLLDFYDIQGDPVVSIANQTHFRLDYNIYDKKTIIATGKLGFTVNPDPDIKPKIEVTVSLTDDWDKGSFRWIWDVVPSHDYRYWRNQTTGELKDINEFGDLTELYNEPQSKIGLHNGISNSIGFLDVSDYGSTTWYAGQEPNWNTKGYVTIFPVNENTIDPITYTETAPMRLDNTQLASNSLSWQKYNITGNNTIPRLAIVEIMGANDQFASSNFVGIRENGSSVNRGLILNEGESGGNTVNRFLVTIASNGMIEVYDHFSIGTARSYYIVGYWENVNFTEQWVQYNTLSSEDDMWHETDGSELTLQANRTHLITLINANVGSQDYLGVRNTSSALDRRLEVMEAEGGGVQTASMYVQTDTDSKIDVYTADYIDVYFINQGYFDENITFSENWVERIPSGGDNTWQDWDLTAYLDEDGRIVDSLCTNIDEGNELNVGVRENGSSDARYLDIGEAEGGGYSGYGMTVNTDVNGVIETYSEDDTFIRVFYGGYFAPPPAPPYSPNITAPNLLFGAGFNESAPFINIRWTHNGTVDNYEIYHGTTNITLSSLAFTPYLNYTHTGLVNGSYHWYKVRSTHFHDGSWYNSSFTPLDLERVYYILGGAGDNITLLDGIWDEYNASSISVIIGTYVHGNTSSTIYLDGKTYKVNEVAITGFDVRFNFTGIPEQAKFLSFRAYCEYEGNPAHEVMIEAWDFVNLVWDDKELIPEHGFSWHNQSLSLGNYIEAVTGNVWIRFEHLSAGSAGHYLQVDYLRLRAFVPIGENVDAWSINWLTSLIWLGLLAIGTSKGSGTLTIFAGFFGLILGLLMLDTNTMVAISLILLNLYLIYTGSE